MAQRATKLRKTEGGETRQEYSSARQTKQGKRSSAKTEQRLNNVFNALTEELLTTLEHNYDTKEG